MNTVLLQRVMANRLCLGQNLVRGLVKISIWNCFSDKCNKIGS
jgi:hypothetical protein